MPLSQVALERKLAENVAAYLCAGGDANQEEQDEVLRRVCSTLEYLLDSLLSESADWNGWIDGILPATDLLPDAVDVIAPLVLQIRARAIWGKDPRGPLWVEPFLASIRLSDADRTVLSYELNFADANDDLGKVPCGKHIRRPDWFHPQHWRFHFSHGDAPHEAR